MIRDGGSGGLELEQVRTGEDHHKLEVTARERGDKMMRVILETSPSPPVTPDITPPLISRSLLGNLKYQELTFLSFQRRK